MLGRRGPCGVRRGSGGEHVAASRIEPQADGLAALDAERREDAGKAAVAGDVEPSSAPALVNFLH